MYSFEIFGDWLNLWELLRSSGICSTERIFRANLYFEAVMIFQPTKKCQSAEKTHNSDFSSMEMKIRQILKNFS